MSAAMKFLYGVALGVSLGIIGSRLLSSANAQRQSPRVNGRRAPKARRRRAREKQPVA